MFKFLPSLLSSISKISGRVFLITLLIVLSAEVLGLEKKLQEKEQLWPRQLTPLTNAYQELWDKYQKLEGQYQELSFAEHLAFIDRLAIEQSRQKIAQKYEELKASSNEEQWRKVEAVYQNYEAALAKMERNENEGLNVEESKNAIPQWGEMFLNQEFASLQKAIEEEKKKLDQDYQNLLAQRAAAAAAAAPTPLPSPVRAQDPADFKEGFAVFNLKLAQGSFTVYTVKYPRARVRLLTLTANKEKCRNNCPAQTLAQYVTENQGIAGIHGTYFCPPDYQHCASKTNSYDFAVYNSRQKLWLNENALGWQNLGLLLVNENNWQLENFYQFDATYQPPLVTAGLQNFPSLLSGGKVIVNNFQLDNYQKSRGVRGAIGFNSADVFLVVATPATVEEMALIMKKLGASEALNLDGGGSAALYYRGSYRVGPGRLLPNAIVLQLR